MINDIETVKEFMKDESLWMDKYSLNSKYYGVYQGKSYGKERDEINEKLKPLIDVLKKVLPDLTMFCNFVTTERGSDSVRYLCEYDDQSHFEGVAYITIDGLLKELSDG